MVHKTIEFPNMGIYLESVGDKFTIFGLDIAFYGIAIGLGILAGIFIAVAEAKRTGQNPEDYYDLALWGVFFSIIGARMYYVIFSWDMYKDDPISIFNIREGGLAIYGGIIAAVITVFVFAKIKKIKALLLLDTVGFGLAAGQMIGRWGNFFNREAFGEYTDGLFAMRIPLDAVREPDVTELIRKKMETIDGVRYIQVHPTFLYESIWCLLLLIVLLIYRKHKKFDGELFLIYLLGYGLGRVWIEGLRTDQLLLPGLDLPVSQLLAGSVILISLGLIIVMRKRVADRQHKEEIG